MIAMIVRGIRMIIDTAHSGLRKCFNIRTQITDIKNTPTTTQLLCFSCGDKIITKEYIKKPYFL
jgi:hypothetical protein